MRSKIIFIILSLFISNSLFAFPSGPVGTPIESLRLSGSIGIGYVNRELENKSGMADRISSLQLYFSGGVGITDNLDLIVFAGFADAKKKLGNFQGTMSPIYGGGIRFTPILQDPSLVSVILEIDGTYFEQEGISSTNPSKLFWGELEGKIGISHNFENYWSLFGGIKYSYEGIKLSTESSKVKSAYPVGIYIGVDYFVTPYVFFEVEMHNFDQDALFMSVGGKF